MARSSPFDTLLLPIDYGFLTEDDDILIMGARVQDDPVEADQWQIFKPFYDELRAAGQNPVSELPDKKYSCVFCLVPKQVEEAKHWIALAMDHLNDGTTLAIAAANDANGNRLVGWLEEAGIHNLQSESANKARVVWGIKNGPVPQGWLKDGEARLHDFGDVKLWTQPGLFSWDRIDAASRLLVENIPPLKGNIADFGCGYGYLSYAVKNASIQSITLVEADARALDCAKKNLEGLNVVAIWHDAAKNLPSAMQFDAIVMNPPFHTGKKTDIDLGQEFIRTAFSSLKRGGKLYMVANNHLPYESLLESLFSSTVRMAQKSGFKVLKAVK